jgi:hypothetical protein
MSQQYRAIPVKDHARYTGKLYHWVNMREWAKEAPIYVRVARIEEWPGGDILAKRYTVVLGNTPGEYRTMDGDSWLYYSEPRVECVVCRNMTDHADENHVCPHCLLNAAQALSGAAWTFYCDLDSTYTGVNIAKDLLEFQVLSSLDRYWRDISNWCDGYYTDAYNAAHDI